MQNSDYIAMSSATIALLALGSTIWQAWLTRRHNQLSVRPLLIWQMNRANTSNGAEVAFVLKNKGIGPAIITKRELALNGQLFTNSGPQSDLVLELVKNVLGSKYKYVLTKYGLPGIGNAILPAEEMVIAHIIFPQMPHDTLTKVLEESGEINLFVDYESLYGQKAQMRTDGSGTPLK